MTDLMVILTLTIGSCVLVGLLGLGGLHLVRHRSLRYQLVIVALLPVLAVALAVLINVSLMFLSRHDTVVVLTALGTALLLAVLSAWLVVRRITQASRQVGAGLQQLVTDSRTRPSEPIAAPDAVAGVPHELARVLDELAVTRRTLTEARERQHAAETSRRELVSFMSHDLRTPLAGLRALAEGLEDGVVEDVPRALAQLRGTVARMTGLVDDLFALSRLQGPGEAKPRMPVSVRELVSDVAAESSVTAATRDVQIDVILPEDDRLAVLGAGDDLTRALANLTSNAIRHTDPGGTVRLEADRTEDEQIEVSVTDGCGGLPEASLGRVFDAGWRGTPARGGDEGRAGLGLAIARGVVEAHAGAITVRNVEGGCRFEITLPPSSRPEAADQP